MARPAMTFQVRSKLDNLLNFKKKIQVANLSEETAKEFARIMRQQVRNRTGPAASGNLAQNIVAQKQGRYGWGVYAPYYVWYVNYGRGPGGEPGATNVKIVNWSARAGLNPKTVSKAIGDYGTTGKFFYEATRAIFNSKKKQIYKRELKKLRKR
jgi:hypothetical protein